MDAHELENAASELASLRSVARALVDAVFAIDRADDDQCEAGLTDVLSDGNTSAELWQAVHNFDRTLSEAVVLARGMLDGAPDTLRQHPAVRAWRQRLRERITCDLCTDSVTGDGAGDSGWRWVDVGWSLACHACIAKIKARAPEPPAAEATPSKATTIAAAGRDGA